MEKRIEQMVLGFFVVVSILIFVGWLLIFFFPVRTVPLGLTYDGYSEDISFSPDGTMLAIKTHEGVILWDVTTGNEIRTFSMSMTGEYMTGVTFSPDGTMLATGYYDNDGGGGVILWDVITGNEIRSFGSGNSVLSVVFSPDGTMLATGHNEWYSGGGGILWNVTTGNEIRSFGSGTLSVQSMAFSPDGTMLATGHYEGGGGGGGGILWDVVTGNLIRSFGSSNHVRSVAFSPDGTILATGIGDGVVLWDVTTGNKIRTVGSSISVWSVVFSPDGTMLATGADSYGGGGVLWNVTTGNEIRVLGGDIYVPSVAFSPDGTLLATGHYEDGVVLWDLNKCFEIFVINQIAGDNAILYTVILITFLIVVEFGLITFSMYKETQGTQGLTEVEQRKSKEIAEIEVRADKLEVRKHDSTLIIRLTAILLVYGGGITVLYGLHELSLFPTYRFNIWSFLGPFYPLIYIPLIFIILILGILTIRRGFRLWRLDYFHRFIAFVTAFSIFFLFVALYALFFLPRGGGTIFASIENILTILVVLSVIFIPLRSAFHYLERVTRQENR